MLVGKTLMLLALIVWIGGLIFFAFVVAPTAFIMLPTTALAGDMVGRSLAALHWMGISSALVFLVSSLFYSRAKIARTKPLALVNLLVLVMLLLTLISQFAITPRMHALRAQLGTADSFQEPARIEFNRLHVWSTRVETAVLVFGLGVVILTAQRLS